MIECGAIIYGLVAAGSLYGYWAAGGPSLVEAVTAAILWPLLPLFHLLSRLVWTNGSGE